MASQPFAVLPPFSISVHALAFTRAKTSTASFRHILAVGLEDGGVQVFSLGVRRGEADAMQLEYQETLCIAALHHSHCAAVRRLCWQDPRSEDESGDAEMPLLASAGDDHAVHVYRLCESDPNIH